ncbi:MAG: L-seryl-tRNA(Sec) selenium transferase [Leucobacter sp.]
MSDSDPRRRIPRVDSLLALPAVEAARRRLSETEIRSVIGDFQRRAREGALPAEQVVSGVEAALSARSTTSLTPVLNATGIVIHTNLGRAPLSESARAALQLAAGYVDVEMDLATGKRSPRGVGAREALLLACPDAEDALVVNNGAAALLLAVTALGEAANAATGTGSVSAAAADAAEAVVPRSTPREIVVSRGEFVEIGAGFRLSDLMTTTGARLREVGTTNRTNVADYASALGSATGCVLKVHPSNFRVEGFTADVGVSELRALLDARAAEGGESVPLVVDLGSGLLYPDPALPNEPDIASALRAGADVVIASGDKLLGGPQAGLLLGRRAAIQRLAKHPLARAVRADKLALAALEATLRGPETPVAEALHADAERLRLRAEAIADRLGTAGRTPRVVPHDGRVGGGGAPGHPLPGWAIELPEELAAVLRAGDPAVVARTHQGRCLVDPRCVAEGDDELLLGALARALDVFGAVAPEAAVGRPDRVPDSRPNPARGRDGKG